jgi:beta-aspartyl-peptidase (threonine type)
MRRSFPWLLAVLIWVGCSGAPTESPAPVRDEAPLAYALAIHGGAGLPRGSLDEAEQREYREALSRVLRLGADMLDGGASAIETVERVVRELEDDARFNAGRGAVFNRDGEHEMDASIMDGASLACGAVAGVRTVRHPIGLARLVMERTDHVLLAGDGAERFAAEAGVERVDPDWFFTQKRWDDLQRRLATGPPESGGSTVGAVARDRDGNLAAATSTGGLTAKMPGRVGDSPIVGAGTYADRRHCAVSCTGTGEEFIRRAAAYQVAARMRFGGATLEEAARAVIFDDLSPGDGGLIAVGADGTIATPFSTPGMLRGEADSAGRFQVAIWDE